VKRTLDRAFKKALQGNVIQEILPFKDTN